MYSVPSQNSKQIFTIGEFKGVDFTSSPIEIDKRRSPNAKNIINKNGYNESRNGYHLLNTIGSCVNGIWNIDTEKGEIFLVHSGGSLYECSNDFSDYVCLLSGMSNERSVGLYFGEYLVIFDGNRAVTYSKFTDSYEAKFLDQCGYIPTTSIARDSTGGGTDYEKINMLSPFQTNTFLPEKIAKEITSDSGEVIYQKVDQTEFILSDTDIQEIVLVQVLKDTGNWEIIPSTDYVFDGNNKVTFKTAPGESPVLGRDSVSIRFKKEYPSNTEKVNKCTIATLYGYGGNNNRIFISGNPDFPNYDFHSEQDDPTYFPDENFTKVGVEPIVNYSRLSDGTLAVQKKQTDTDCTAYHRTSNLLDSIEVFPLQDGVKNIGCISRYANCNLLNDPLTLTNQGVFAIVGSTAGEKYVQQRSYYINNRLMKEENLENAVAITVAGRYYLAVNNHMYVADSRYLSYPKHAKTEQYQYEWYYWDNIPARVLCSWNDKLIFGTNDGKIFIFDDGYTDNNKPIDVYWETPFLELNSSNLAKTIKNVTLILNPCGDCDITFGYVLDDGSVEIISKNYSALKDDFPKTIQEKEKIQKFMFVKFFFKNSTVNRMTFERLILEYINSGKYRGE